MGAGASLNIPEHLKDDPIIKETYDRILDVFGKYDSRKYKQLSRDDFYKLCQDFSKHFTNVKDIETAFTYLDKNHDAEISLAEFNRLWEGFSTPPPLHSIEQRMEDFRIDVANKYKIAFGLSFREFERAGQLDEKQFRTWGALDVYLWLIFCPALAVVREDLDRGMWADVDGECLLELTEGSLREKRIKEYHTKKFLQAIDVHLRKPDGKKSVSPPPIITQVQDSTDGSMAETVAQGPRNGSPRPMRMSPRGDSLSGSQGSSGFQWKKGDLLGQGAYGKVYAGLDTRSGIMMAVKEMTFTRDSAKEVEELKNEIRLLRKLQHEHIVQYFGAEIPAESEGCVIHIFTELMPQGSLTHMMKKFGKFSEEMTCNYTRQMVSGLVYLHDNNIIHRDIKPANVLVNESGIVKLADFGASKKMSGTETVAIENTTLKGTPYFMAPEVLIQKGHGRKADVWSLGATVLQLISGDPPWKSMKFDSVVQLMCHVAGDETAKPELPPKGSVSEKMYSFLEACFTRDVTKRPNSKQLSKHKFLTSNGKEGGEMAEDPMNNTLASIDRSLSQMDESQNAGVESEDEDFLDMSLSVVAAADPDEESVKAAPVIQTSNIGNSAGGGGNPFGNGPGGFSPDTPGAQIAAVTPKGDAAGEETFEGEETAKKKKKKHRKKRPGTRYSDDTVAGIEEGGQAGNAAEVSESGNAYQAYEERAISSVYHQQNLETLNAEKAEEAANALRDAEYAKMRVEEINKFQASQSI